MAGSHPSRRNAVGCLGALALAAALACEPASKPILDPPVVELSLELLSDPPSQPDPDYDATCQTGDAFLFKATGSHDPAGMPIEYEWKDFDVLEGELTDDFAPMPNPMRVREPEVGVSLYRIGIHEITLTVRAADGRKASRSMQVLVTPCRNCGGGTP